MSKRSKSDLEQDARIALLQHYSSKSTNQAIIILTLGILFFTSVQTLLFSNAIVCGVFLLFLFPLFTLLLIRAIIRLLFWSRLSDIIMTIESLSDKDADDECESVKKQYEKLLKTKPNLTPTYLWKLHKPCHDLADKLMKTRSDEILDISRIYLLYRNKSKLALLVALWWVVVIYAKAVGMW